jgi:hypothetical protein
MKARKNGEYWQISWIAGGNSHQFLGIIFSITPVSETAFVVETIGNEHPRIDQKLLRDAVQHGLKQYANETGQVSFANTIRYVESDSPNYDQYSRLAYVLVEHWNDDV